jgi:hypothetical protein
LPDLLRSVIALVFKPVIEHVHMTVFQLCEELFLTALAKPPLIVDFDGSVLKFRMQGNEASEFGFTIGTLHDSGC